jgi:pyridoxine kinase
MRVLSIQSWVAYGHVGNASAMFPLQRLGAEVWAIHTVQFSNHTGYRDWTGTVFTGESVRALVDGIAARGVLGSCDAVLSGYLGDAGIAQAVLDAVARVRSANPAALYCCDPVIGDTGRGVYVRPGIAEFLRERAVPAADILTPNQFELEFLVGGPVTTLAQAIAAARALLARGPRCVLVTSLRTDATPADALDMLAVEGDACHLLRTPLLALAPDGAGDVTAALFLLHRSRTGSAAAALEATASAVFGLLRRTAAAGAAELQIVAAQEEFVAPSTRFRASAC